MITVHHLDHSRSQRVLWLLEELGLPYEVRNYRRDPKTWLAPPELAAVHPLGKSPVLTDDDGGEPLVVAETGAIFEHLLDRVPGTPLRPEPGSAEARRFRYWLHFAEGSAMPPLVLKLIFNRIQTAPMPFFAKPIAKAIAAKVLDSYIDPTLRSQLRFVEAELAARPCLCGDAFSAVDILMSFPLESARERAGLTPQSHPRICAWLDAIHARPAHGRALARGAG
jgi:glutathione S-transferase